MTIPPAHSNRSTTRLLALALCLTMCLPPAIIVSAAENHTNHAPTTLTYQFAFEPPTLTTTRLYGRTFSQLHLSGAMNLGKDVGGPSMPVSFVKLALPAETTIEAITVTGPAQTINAPGLLQQPLMPFQRELPFSSPAPTEIAYDAALYHLTTPYPSTTYDDDYSIGYCRGYTILSLPLMSVQYIPNSGTLLFHPQLTISITLKPAAANPLLRYSADDEAWVRSLVSNPEVLSSYGSVKGPFTYPGGLCGPSQHYDYVIITTTTNSLNQWATNSTVPYNWDSLLAQHAMEGLSGTVVTTQVIQACHDYYNPDPLFNDSQARIREFCKDAYQDWGTMYVLIGADGEANYIPARLMDYSYESNVDADIYWSNLDNTFNADHDTHWGEEGDLGFDLYSELYIGRLTCDTPKDVSNWMTKSFEYINENDLNILENAAFYGGDTTWNCQGDDFVDYSAIKGTTNWLGPNPGAHGAYPAWLGFQYGFQTWNQHNPAIPYNLTQAWTAEPTNPGWRGGSESAAIAGLRNAINSNNVTLLSGIAHADPTMSLDVYDSDWRTLYTNTKPFFITDYGCHCGDFTGADDGVLDAMLFYSTHLAFGCTYNTGYGWGSQSDTNSSSALQQKLFWDYMFDMTNHSNNTANWQLGKAHAYSKDEMAPTVNWTYTGAPGSWRGIIESCLLFADPAQRIKPVRLNHQPTIPTTPDGPTSGTVAVNYTFTTSATDPDNDSLYYRFDWGDGTTSGWVGPFDSGASGNASHFWTSGGNFTVKVQARDFQFSTEWSDSIIIRVGCPILQVQDIKGGIGVRVTFLNVGDGNAITNWRITVTGGRISLQKTGQIESLPVNEPQTVRPFPLFSGLGKIKIMVEASAVYGNELTAHATGFLLGPFVLRIAMS